MRVAILDDIHDAWASTEGVRRLRAHTEVEIFTGPFGDASRLEGFEALIANRERTRFTRELLSQLPDLKILVQTGNHAHHVDFEAAGELGVLVARASGGYSIGAAELTMGLALAVTRRIAELDASLKQGHWPAPLTPVLHGKTLGIIGLGRVGGHVARLGAAFGMRILAWSPRLDDARAREAGAECVDLENLLAASDIVSIHASLTPSSRGLLDARRLALMKPGAYLVNTARGPIVEESALIEALESGRIAGAGLDVFDQEPPGTDHPLRRLPNVVLTPHIGWPTDQGYAQFAWAAADVLLDYLAGQAVPRFGR
jgi:phosphoglycerate dehydrogenase-like enzyme